MRKILPLYIICLIFAYLSHRSSVYDHRLGQYKYKDRIFYAVVIIAAVIFAGLRTNYNDTASYISIYEKLDVSAGWLSRIDWSIGEYPLFDLSNAVMKKLGFSSQSFVMAYSALTMGVSLWFVWKYTNDTVLSVFLFFAMGCFGFSMAAMKQCAATAFCLIGTDRLLRERKLLFFFWVFVGILFHPFAAVFLVCPLLLFSPWTAPTYLMIAVCAVAGFSMQTWLGRALNLMAMVGVEYEDANLLEGGVSIFRFLVVLAPILLSFMAARFWRQSKNKASNLIMNLSILCAELMFIALFGNPIYFGRLANYFLIFQAICIPLVLFCYEFNSRTLLKIFTIMGYTGYTMFDSMFNRGTFDSGFGSISFWKYISEIL